VTSSEISVRRSGTGTELSDNFAAFSFPPSPLEGSGTKSTITEGTAGLLYQPRMMDDDECGTVGGMSGRGN
jgi:hypothetical protein